MKLLKTTKQHWVNGYQTRGKNFKTLNLSLFNFGVMFSGNILPFKSVKFYRLIKDYQCKTVQDCFDDDVMGILRDDIN